VLEGHTGSVETLVAAPDGSWLASAGYYDVIRIWVPSAGQVLHTLIRHTKSVLGSAVSANGRARLRRHRPDDPRVGRTRAAAVWPRCAPVMHSAMS
jgi:WD40 repeat protein